MFQRKPLSILAAMAMLLTVCTGCGNQTVPQESSSIYQSETENSTDVPLDTEYDHSAVPSIGDSSESQEKSEPDNSSAVSSQASSGSSSSDSSSSGSDSSGTTPTPPADMGVPENTFDPTNYRAGIHFVSMDAMPQPSASENKDSTKEFTRFAVTSEDNPKLPFGVALHISGDSITGMLPAGVDISSLVVNFTYVGSAAYVDDVPMVSRQTRLDFRRPVSLRLKARDGSERTVTVRLETLNTGLPSISVTMDHIAVEAIPRDKRVPCTVYVGGGDSKVAFYADSRTILASAGIKGRGHSSWSMEKKGYNIKFDEKQSLFDLPSSKHWALVSGYQDKTLLRNYMASELAGMLGMEVNMRVRPVDLWINGEFYGNYSLIEKIEVEKNRIPITAYDPSLGPEEVGYHLEADGHVCQNETSPEDWNNRQYRGEAIYYPQSDTLWFQTDMGVYITISEPKPDEISQAQIDYIIGYVRSMERAFSSRDFNRISQYIDADSFINWMIVEDTFKNTDATMWSSCHMYKDAGGKLKMGPVWDFDMSVGNCNYNQYADEDYLTNAHWFHDLFKTSGFRSKLQARWREVKPLYLDTLCGRLDQAAAMLDKSQRVNFLRWTILDKPVASNPDFIAQANTYAKQLQVFKDFWNQRLTYLNNSYLG